MKSGWLLKLKYPISNALTLFVVHEHKVWLIEKKWLVFKKNYNEIDCQVAPGTPQHEDINALGVFHCNMPIIYST